MNFSFYCGLGIYWAGITLNYISTNKLTLTTKANIYFLMTQPVSIRIDLRMKEALEKLAEKEFTSVSGLLKKGAEKLLKEHDIDWRKKEKE